MANEDALTQMQVGTLAALVAVCDALVAAKAVKATALIDRLVVAMEGIAAAHAQRGETQ